MQSTTAHPTAQEFGEVIFHRIVIISPRNQDLSLAQSLGPRLPRPGTHAAGGSRRESDGRRIPVHASAECRLSLSKDAAHLARRANPFY